MKNLILILVILTTNMISAQLSEKFPKDDNGNVVHTKIVTLENKSKDQLYILAKMYFAETFKSANDVIQLDDKENGVILGKGITNFMVKSGKYNFNCKMSFTMKVSIKDNKCKLEVYNIVYNDTSTAESNYSKEADQTYNNAKQKIKDIMDGYATGTLNFLQKLDDSVVNTINKKPTDW